MKKIEKLEGSYDVPQLKQKLNEIIDYLNTQPQAGVFPEFTDKNISDDIPKGFVDIDGKLHKFEDTPEEKYKKGDKVKLTLADKDGWITGEFEVAGVEVEQPEEKKTLEQIREEFDKERVKEWDRTAMETYKQATQDTTEEKEEWVEMLDNSLKSMKLGVSGSQRDWIYNFIKNLLSEREREVLRGLLDDHYDPNSDSIEIDVSEIQKELDKLTTK